MNDQQAFDKMVTHLFTQKEPAMDDNGYNACFYRMPCGKMCAVGALIPDKQYDENFERKSIDDIYDNIPALKGVSLSLKYDVGYTRRIIYCRLVRRT